MRILKHMITMVLNGSALLFDSPLAIRNMSKILKTLARSHTNFARKHVITFRVDSGIFQDIRSLHESAIFHVRSCSEVHKIGSFLATRYSECV